MYAGTNFKLHLTGKSVESSLVNRNRKSNFKITFRMNVDVRDLHKIAAEFSLFVKQLFSTQRRLQL